MRRCRRSCDSVRVVVVDGGGGGAVFTSAVAVAGVSWVRARRQDGRVRGGAVVVRFWDGPELVVVPDGGGGRVNNR